jgi:micrococcal nuclease
MRRRLTLAAAIVILIAAIINLFPAAAPDTLTVVTRVVDGDTIVVEGGESVRLLDIDTPEKGEPCAANATNRLKDLIDNKEVLLVSGKENRDKYDRLLRYVFLNDTLINLVMVREGWANLYIFNKDPRFYESFLEAEQLAKAENLCVWG